MIRRINVFVILLSILFIPSITAASLINGDFEDWTTSNPPPGWSLSSPGLISATQETTIVHSGSSSAQIDYTSQNTQSLSQTITATPDFDYSMSAWLYDDSPEGRARLYFNFLDGGGSTLSTYYSGYTEDSNSWQQLWLNATAPSETASLTVSFRFYDVSASWDGDATIFIDDVSLSAVPIPSAIWLLGSGLIGIIGIRRKLRKG